MSDTRKWIIGLLCITFVVNLGIFMYSTHIANRFVDKFDSNDNVYVICDVYDAVYNGDTAEINIILPNGELLTRYMKNEDLPEGFSEVVIETSDLDDYSTYKIVGMR